MSTDDDNLREAARRCESMLEELNTRIARLALVLGVSLESDEDFDKILNRTSPFFLEHSHLHATSGVTSAEHRLLHKWEELRGLLVLRCDMMASTLSQLGLEATLEITVQAEAHLQREGFTPGADGLNLFRQKLPE